VWQLISINILQSPSYYQTQNINIVKLKSNLVTAFVHSHSLCQRFSFSSRTPSNYWVKFLFFPHYFRISIRTSNDSKVNHTGHAQIALYTAVSLNTQYDGWMIHCTTQFVTFSCPHKTAQCRGLQ